MFDNGETIPASDSPPTSFPVCGDPPVPPCLMLEGPASNAYWDDCDADTDMNGDPIDCNEAWEVEASPNTDGVYNPAGQAESADPPAAVQAIGIIACVFLVWVLSRLFK